MIRPNEQRAKYAIILLWTILALETIGLVSGYFQYRLLQDINEGAVFPYETLNANDARQQVIAVVHIICYIISIVVFIQWFRRAYYNLHIVSPNNLKHNEEWALWSWFVPIISLFRPFQIMKEMYIEAKDLLVGRDIEPKYFDFMLLGWWWGLWIAGNLVGQAVFRMSRQAESIDSLIDSTIAEMVSAALGIACAVLAIKVVKNYSFIETYLYAGTEELGMDRLINSIGQPEKPREDDLSLQEEY